jgi:hypothetical protein
MGSLLRWCALVVCGLSVMACGATGSTSTGSPPSGDATVDARVDAGGEAQAPLHKGDSGPPTCGDGVCNGKETCISCSLDCGQCEACPLAPTCSNALGEPTSPTPRPDLDQGLADAGADADAHVVVPSSMPGDDGCENPQLRMRIESITTNSGSGTTVCMVEATDGSTSEVATTSETGDLSDGQTFYFDPGTSVFWGQNALHTTTNNLTITYNCFLVVDNSAWAATLTALGSAAKSAGGIAGPYGWVFGAGSAAAAAAAAALQANSGNDLMLNAQQTIAKTELLDLTNGRVWTIRKTGGSCSLGGSCGSCDLGANGSCWDWQIDVESWGCAAGNGTKTSK